MPLWPVWKSAGQAGLGDHLVERVGHPVVREELLDVGVELEAAHVVLVDQPPGALGRVLAVRVHARERDHHVGVGGGRLGDLLVRDGLAPAARLVVDREHHARHLALAVVRRHVVRGRPVDLAAEVALGRRPQLGRHRVVAVTRRPRRACARRSRGRGRRRSSGAQNGNGSALSREVRHCHSVHSSRFATPPKWPPLLDCAEAAERGRRLLVDRRVVHVDHPGAQLAGHGGRACGEPDCTAATSP